MENLLILLILQSYLCLNLLLVILYAVSLHVQLSYLTVKFEFRFLLYILQFLQFEMIALFLSCICLLKRTQRIKQLIFLNKHLLDDQLEVGLACAELAQLLYFILISLSLSKKLLFVFQLYYCLSLEVQFTATLSLHSFVLALQSNHLAYQIFMQVAKSTQRFLGLVGWILAGQFADEIKYQIIQILLLMMELRVALLDFIIFLHQSIFLYFYHFTFLCPILNNPSKRPNFFIDRPQTFFANLQLIIFNFINFIFLLKFSYSLPLDCITRVEFLQFGVIDFMLLQQQFLTILFSNQLVLQCSDIRDHFKQLFVYAFTVFFGWVGGLLIDQSLSQPLGNISMHLQINIETQRINNQGLLFLWEKMVFLYLLQSPSSQFYQFQRYFLKFISESFNFRSITQQLLHELFGSTLEI